MTASMRNSAAVLPMALTGQQVGRDAHRRRTAEADKLALGQVEGESSF